MICIGIIKKQNARTSFFLHFEVFLYLATELRVSICKIIAHFSWSSSPAEIKDAEIIL